ncbi:hypothetical protein Sjap_016706 [Stephania japonica]|uniref:DNA replication licensing factor MCM2 n=1 Tax=Stephania japonica TaxID=461633 RepID=A0AAP0NTP1_9MAGN
MDNSENPSTPGSPTSAGFSTDRLPPNTSRTSDTYSDEEEAAVDPEIVRDEPEEVDEEEEEGEDLYNDNYMDDYRRMEEQDQYESVGLHDSMEDERDLDQIMADRRAAEVELDARDDGHMGNRKLPRLLHDQDTDEDVNYRRPKRSRADFRPPRDATSVDDTDGMHSSPGRSQHAFSRDDIPMTDQTDDEHYEDEDDDDDGEFEMYRVQGTLREWVTRDEVRRFIAKKFKEFLLTFVNPKHEPGNFEYIRLINEMVAANRCSLEIDYKQFIHIHPNIAIWLADAPQSVLEVMEDVAKNVVFNLHPNYKNIHQKIYVRITNLPVYDEIRNIRQIHLNTLIRIGGVVTRRSGVFPQLQQVKYDCNKCGMILGPFFQNSYSEVKVGSCPECQSKGPFTVNIEQTVYRNYQKLTLQESPGIVPAGRLPRYKEVILLNDLIDFARPGEEIEVTGIYSNNFDLSLNTKNGFPVFATLLEANYVTKKQDLFSAYKLNQEDKEEIEKLAKDPRIGERIIKSIAPSIYGHEDIKTAIALAMFGGQEKNVEGKHRLRGDINVLLLGDPGTAKSQFLKYVEKTGQRAVYTTGKGASAVGLTAAVHKDPVTREWTLEGAMEQQSISISKAGIVTSLQARCAVIAAANPIGGRQCWSLNTLLTRMDCHLTWVLQHLLRPSCLYDSSKTFAQNVELTDPIISRFDILCVVKDVVDPVADELLANFVVDSHFKSQPKGANLGNNSKSNPQEDASAPVGPLDPEILSQDMLKKYITYAKLYVFPRLHDADLNKLSHVYAELRRESSHGQGVPIAVRHIESMIRMSEAHARMHLRQHVTQEDVDMAIRVLLDSFISTQKFGVQKALQKSFRKYMTFKKEYNDFLLYLLRGLVRDALHFEELVNGPCARLNYIEVKIEELQNKAQDYEIYDLKPFFSSTQFSGANFEIDEDNGVIRHRLAKGQMRNADELEQSHACYDIVFIMEGKQIPLKFVLLLVACISFRLCSSDKVFYESFDESFDGRWTVSEKDDYKGVWKHAKSEGHDDYGLLVSEKARKYAIVKELDEPVNLKDGTVVLQYETRLQNGLECGGAYLKYLRPQEAGWTTKNFDNESPYSIMFGPDKCGSTNKVHFILKHKNPKSGEYVEHHLKYPPSVPSDKLSHVYTAILRPNNELVILVDGEEKKTSNFLSNEDFEPALIPDKTIADPNDKKPEDWDERAKIPDPDAVKPDDWDEDAPMEIEDEEAEKPEGWLDDEPEEIDDPEASKPEDWDDEEDGEWEAPKIDNPKCESAPGCGEWKRPMKRNPVYKGKWHAPLIDNPNYKGIWKPQQIPNPDYFELEKPDFEPIAAIGIELWTMQDGILFDNILIATDAKEAESIREKTWKPKFDVEKEKQKAEEEAAGLPSGLSGFQKKVFDLLYKVADVPFLATYKVKILEIIEKGEKQPNLTLGILVSVVLVVLTVFFRLIFGGKKPEVRVNVERKNSGATETSDNQGTSGEKEEPEREREDAAAAAPRKRTSRRDN